MWLKIDILIDYIIKVMILRVWRCGRIHIELREETGAQHAAPLEFVTVKVYTIFLAWIVP